MIAESLLLEPVKAIMGALTRKGVDLVFDGDRWKAPPLESTLKVALGLAVLEYSTTGNNQVLAKPLLGKRGLLANKEVAEQFAAALSGPEPPDAVIVGSEWRLRLKDPPAGVDFTKEAQALIGHFMSQRRWVAEARDVRELQLLEQLADTSVASVNHVESIDSRLVNLSTMLEEGFGIVSRRGLQHLRYDQTSLIEEHTREFVGRGFVFDAIARKLHTSSNASALITVTTPPGVGKTAMMAMLVRRRNCVYHFNRRQGGGPTTLPKLLGNISVQLIAKYQIDFDLSSRSSPAIADSSVLADVLRKVHSNEPDPPPLIVIDALDEMDSWVKHGLAFLPDAPAHFVISVRSDLYSELPRALAGLEWASHTVNIDPLSAKNKTDIRWYVQQRVKEPGIREYLTYHNITQNNFIDDMDHRSEGNFMYLRHVLHSIARGELRDRKMQDLPAGLKAYYADHLAQMSADGAAWEDYRLPIIAELSCA